jgi:hypothetical protein
MGTVAGSLVSALALDAGPALADTASFTTQGCTTWALPSGVASVQISAVSAAGAGAAGTVATVGATGGRVSAALSVASGRVRPLLSR